jgi:hypothetical protein
LRKLGRGLQPNKQLLLKFLCYEFIRLQYFVVLFNSFGFECLLSILFSKLKTRMLCSFIQLFWF